MNLRLKAAILSCLLFSVIFSIGQPTRFSLATDFTVVRSFKKDQRFWTVGQTIAAHFHINPRNGVYVLFAVSGQGRFHNQLSALAKDPMSTPQSLSFNNRAKMRYNHFSLGWKHYLKGSFNAEYGWNLYGYGGFGLMFGKVDNYQSPGVDTTVYHSPVMAGPSSFKRLTLDLGLGYEVPLGGDVFFYIEGRALVPTTEYPSRYLVVNEDAPFTGSANIGIRVLFD